MFAQGTVEYVLKAEVKWDGFFFVTLAGLELGDLIPSRSYADFFSFNKGRILSRLTTSLILSLTMRLMMRPILSLTMRLILSLTVSLKSEPTNPSHKTNSERLREAKDLRKLYSNLVTYLR